MRETPSWTVTTLEALRAERGPDQPLGFIIGQDSLLNLSGWHRWQDLLSLCHLLVCKRPGYPTEMASPEMQRWLESHLAVDTAQLHQPPRKSGSAVTPACRASSCCRRPLSTISIAQASI